MLTLFKKSNVSYLFFVIRLLFLINFSLVVVLFILYFNRSPNQYYTYHSNTHTSTKLPALLQPNVSPSSLLNWAVNAVTAAYFLEFGAQENYLQSLREYFTKQGYDKYIESIQKNLTDINQKKINQFAVVSGVPLLLNEGFISDTYTWQVRIPLLITYETAGNPTTEKQRVVTVMIIRVPTSDAPKGIGISQLLETQMEI